jgi:protein tyrosine phosphatase (PTP) superfamily phosphohydrolase (DUF442 family)
MLFLSYFVIKLVIFLNALFLFVIMGRRTIASMVVVAALAGGAVHDGDSLSFRLGLESLPIIGYNLIAVNDSLYRSAMPDQNELHHLKAKGLEVVISTRGHNPGDGFHDDEKDLCGKLDLTYETVQFSASEPSEPEQYIRFIQLLDKYDGKKKLVHCNSGCDRSSLAAALYVLYGGGSLNEANVQFSKQRGFFKQSNYMMRLVSAVAGYIQNKENKAEAMKEFFRSEYLDFYRQNHPNPRQFLRLG